MIMEMKHFLLVLISFLFFSPSVFAYELNLTKISKPYDVLPVTLDSDTQKVYLGTLDNFPVMYEVEVDATTTLSLKLSQQYSVPSKIIPFALMIVRKNDDGNGVTEIARFYPKSEDWVKEKDSELGLTFLVSKIISNKISSGTYNIEVSTPENIGKFSLFFGKADKSVGYFDRLKQVRTTQKFFGYSLFKILISSLIYYPLGIIFILFFINRIFKYKKVISNVS